MKTLDQMTLEELKNCKPETVEFGVILEMASKLSRAFNPDRIVLFGSYARGEATEHSDIDFLVIMPTDQPRPKRSVPMYRLLRNYLLSVDIIVRTQEEADEYANLPFSFMQTALREGVTLYDREA